MIGPLLFIGISALAIGVAVGWYAKSIKDAVEKDKNEFKSDKQ